MQLLCMSGLVFITIIFFLVAILTHLANQWFADLHACLG